jgi:hypothetical protein
MSTIEHSVEVRVPLSTAYKASRRSGSSTRPICTGLPASVVGATSGTPR